MIPHEEPSVHYGSHSQLRNTSLKKCTTEISFYKRFCVFKKTVSLIRVRKVGDATIIFSTFLASTPSTAAEAALVAIPSFWVTDSKSISGCYLNRKGRVFGASLFFETHSAFSFFHPAAYLRFASSTLE